MVSRLVVILAMLAVILTSPLPGLAQMTPDASSDVGSQTLFGDRLTLKAGYKVWIAKWQAPLAGSGGATQITADHPSVMSGPTFTGRFKLRDGEWFNSVFANFYWLNAGFDFQEARFTNTSTSGTAFTFNTQNAALRRDYALTAGITIWEGFGVFGGYYDNRQRFTTINRPLTTGGGTFLGNRKLTGPIFGVFGSTPVSKRVSVYGSLAYAALEFEAAIGTTNSLSSKSVHGYATELGINVTGPRVWKIGTELQLGFRYQEIQKTFGGSLAANGSTGFDTIANDITYGPTFTINAVF